jgi:outer membrane protein assembly factor BamB
MRRRLSLVIAFGMTLSCGGGASRSAPETPREQTSQPAPSESPIVVAVPPPEPEKPPVESDEAPAALTIAGDGDWAQFHGGPERHGVSSAPAIKTPSLLWKTRVGIQGYTNSPLVVGQVVLVPSSGKAHNTPDPEDGLVALDLSTGRKAWFAHFDNDANGAVADKDRAYVGSDDGNFYAVDLKTGSVAWKQATKGKAYGHPLLVDSLVIAGDATGYVRAFDKATGTPKWATQLTGAIRGGASSDGRTLYVVSQAGELAALSLDGRVLYQKTIERPPWGDKGKDVPIEAYSPPIIADNLLILPFARDTYYSNVPALYALEKKTGKLAWRSRGTGDWGNIRTTPVLVGGLLIYAEPYSGDVAAVSSTTGRVIYRNTIGACFFPQWSSPAAASEIVYLMRFDGVLHALHATDGKSAWRFYLGDSTRVGTSIPSELENMQGCEWDVPTGHPAYSPVTVASNGTLLVGTSEGFLYAIGQK